MAIIRVLQSARRLPALLGSYGQPSIVKNCTNIQLLRSVSNFSCAKISSVAVLDKNTCSRPLTQSLQVPKLVVNQSRTASTTTGDHVRLWQIERLISASFIVLFPACFILENPIVDGATAVLLVMHSHWGLDALILDYLRPAVVGPVIPKVSHFLLNLLSAVTLAGLMTLIYNGPGFAKSIKDFWAIGEEE